MALRPTSAFRDVALETRTVAAGRRFGHIYPNEYPDPLGFGKTPSRFSDPRRRAATRRFGLLYLGSSLKVCFLETVLRDSRNGVVGDYPISESELNSRNFVAIEVVRPLKLVSLLGDDPVRMGVPSDVARGSQQTLARAWSAAFHEHPAAPDGIIYASRLNGETSLAIYGRAVTKRRALPPVPLIRASGLADVLNDLKVALVGAAQIRPGSSKRK
jgi:hypothetical protein